jgi:hypothetical protein
MTPTLLFRFIYERNTERSMEMSFFGIPLAQTWLARTFFYAADAIDGTKVTSDNTSSRQGGPDICITSALRIAMQLFREYENKVEVHCIRFSGPYTHICLRRAYSKKRHIHAPLH